MPGRLRRNPQAAYPQGRRQSDAERVYRQEAQRQKVLAFKAEIAHARLLFIVNALKTLLGERMFVRLLRDQSLDKLPIPILRRISSMSAASS